MLDGHVVLNELFPKCNTGHHWKPFAGHIVPGRADPSTRPIPILKYCVRCYLFET